MLLARWCTQSYEINSFNHINSFERIIFTIKVLILGALEALTNQIDEIKNLVVFHPNVNISTNFLFSQVFSTFPMLLINAKF